MLGRIKDRIRRAGSDGDPQANANSNSNGSTVGKSAGSNGGSHHGSNGIATSSVSSYFRDSQHQQKDDDDYHAKLTDLASFDACVEACDALAATCSSQYSHYNNASIPMTDNSNNNDNKYNTTTTTTTTFSDNFPVVGIKDCSVIVSPDGDLLLVPQTKQEQALVASLRSSNDKEIHLDNSVVLGNDLKPAKEVNGFSSMGWSAAAASLAIRQTEQTLRHTQVFLTQVHQAAVESQKQHLLACHQLRQATGIGEYPSMSQSFPPTPLPKSMRNNSKSNRRSFVDLNSLSDLEPTGSAWNKASGGVKGGELEKGPHRVGPLVYSGSSLYAAMIAVESYFTKIPIYRPTVQKDLTERADQTAERAYYRERTLKEMQRKAYAAEQALMQAKAYAKQKWNLVHQAEEQVTHLVEERMLIRSKAREKKRMELLNATSLNHQQHAVEFATSAEIWDIVAAATASMEDGDFTPIDFPSAPIAGVMDQTEHSEQSGGGMSDIASSHSSLPSNTVDIPMASRVDIEQECNLPALRSAAMAAEDAVDDAAQTLLNCLSIWDTTRRSARVAAETNLLAACNAQAESLQRIVQMERAALQERMARLEQMEQVMAQVNVRQDLDRYITVDKKERGGSTWMGDYDDGGIASALAILSSHVEGSTGMGPGSPMKGQQSWAEDPDEETSPEVLEDAINEIFETELTGDAEVKESFDKSVHLLCRVAADRKAPRSKRSAISYALNAKRTSAEFTSQENFDALCEVFDAILRGCDHEPGSVAIAKMCMMLSQTFYIEGTPPEGATAIISSDDVSSGENNSRNKRIYVKSKLIGHDLWKEDEFWDQALYQCVTESLTHSGVMANFDRATSDRNDTMMRSSEWAEARTLQWHDLTHAERSEAASQVHAVVFAQLGALAHSMMEFGCGMERSCAFVRRMSVRNQLPISQRTMLLQHLVGNASTIITNPEDALQ